MSMWNGSSDLVLDTCIQHNYGWEGIRSSKFSIYFLTFEEQGWKEKQSGKMSTIRFPGLNSLLKKEKEGENLLHLSSTSIMGDLSRLLYLAIRWLVDAL